MLEVHFFSERQVRQRLFDSIQRTTGPLLVTQVRQERSMSAVGEREPFRTLERELGELLTMVVVADEGSAEGMWRDPMGDLAESLFPKDRERAYAAATGYLLLEDGAVQAVLGKRSSWEEDLEAIEDAVSKLRAAPPPGPRGHRTRPAGSRGPAPDENAPTPPMGTPREPDPWAILGIPSGAPLTDARRAFRARISLYHPDKVAHLAPEFQRLAEDKTRELTSAWEAVQRAGDPE